MFMVTNGNCIFLTNTLCPADLLFRTDNFYLLMVFVYVYKDKGKREGEGRDREGVGEGRQDGTSRNS